MLNRDIFAMLQFSRDKYLSRENSQYYSPKRYTTEKYDNSMKLCFYEITELYLI